MIIKMAGGTTVALFAILCPPLFAETSDISAAVYFSPSGRATQAVVDEIGKANQSVYVLAY